MIESILTMMMIGSFLTVIKSQLTMIESLTLTLTMAVMMIESLSTNPLGDADDDEGRHKNKKYRKVLFFNPSPPCSPLRRMSSSPSSQNPPYPGLMRTIASISLGEMFEAVSCLPPPLPFTHC